MRLCACGKKIPKGYGSSKRLCPACAYRNERRSTAKNKKKAGWKSDKPVGLKEMMIHYNYESKAEWLKDNRPVDWGVKVAFAGDAFGFSIVSND